jgi:hypothetical protein
VRKAEGGKRGRKGTNLLGADVAVDELGNVGREGDEGRSCVSEDASTPPRERKTKEKRRRTSVDSRSSVLQLQLLISKLNLLQLNLPVPLPPNRYIVDLTRVMTRVKSTERRLALFRVRTEPESKDGVIEEVLVDHLVEGGNDAGDGDGVVGETEDTVCENEEERRGGDSVSFVTSKATTSAALAQRSTRERQRTCGQRDETKSERTELSESERQSRLIRRLSKVLLLDGEVTDGKGVLGDDTLESAGTVLDLELGAVRLVGGRLGGVVLRLKDGRRRSGASVAVEGRAEEGRRSGKKRKNGEKDGHAREGSKRSTSTSSTEPRGWKIPCRGRP